jgi:hypothetical protein
VGGGGGVEDSELNPLLRKLINIYDNKIFLYGSCYSFMIFVFVLFYFTYMYHNVFSLILDSKD